jgi:hypothetical protein
MPHIDVQGETIYLCQQACATPLHKCFLALTPLRKIGIVNGSKRIEAKFIFQQER